MPSFTYTAKDSQGAASDGSIDAPSRREALRRLQTRGLRPIKVEEVGAARRETEGPSAKGGAEEAPTAAECLPFLEAMAD